ncbi:MAG TPA: MGMT family protein [Abditibacteriaceae bacterium]|nr:MGMT family protein [Abditibacteriaceae bacterium]
MEQQKQLFEDAASTAPEPADASTDAAIIAQVRAIVSAIPSGRVMSYGVVGARCQPPISGYICGRIMIRSHAETPWWRVVGKDGALPIVKRNPQLAEEQRRRLESEGVSFDAERRVAAACFES